VTERPLVTIDEARRLLAEAGSGVERIESCPLHALNGRVLAEAITAASDVPRFARSAMDGFAVRASDTAAASPGAPVLLHVVDEAWAGHPARDHVAAGHAIAIATGAVLPDGADAVVMVEDTVRRDDEVTVRAAVVPGQHVSPRASDLSAGGVALEAGLLLTPARVGVVAALGMTEAVVYGRPRVAVLSSGDEVVAPGEALGPGQVHDVNSYTLGAIVTSNGGELLRPMRVRDTDAAVERAVRDSLDADLVLVSGGSSVGGRDFVLEVLSRLGEIRFHGIAVKPGKPTVLAVVDGRPVLGMPGNPTSCLSNAYILLVPFLRATARLPLYAPRTLTATLGRRIVSQAGRHQFYTVRLAGTVAFPAFKGSGDITSLSQADGYIEIPASEHTVEEGSVVDVTLF